ncbi:hypothetical protein OCU04_011010 [Sclerotinia nivalis]|uniref:Uncharacterized protein n=1 Tax=Sclerotinia nivalis TaxID=352851 RepID=A0A9X0DFM1_9HELO|nr:hypothetical protein OCU04_011010 [Sclerotinia nivalis]
MSSKNLPWFDALLLGPRHPVIQDRYPPGTKIQKEFHTFHPREGPWTAEREREVAAERDRVFGGLMHEMDFMFSYFYSHHNARDNDPPNHDPNYPVKKWGDPLGVTTVNAWEMVVKKVPNAKVCGAQHHVRLFGSSSRASLWNELKLIIPVASSNVYQCGSFRTPLL